MYIEVGICHKTVKPRTHIVLSHFHEETAFFVGYELEINENRLATVCIICAQEKQAILRNTNNNLKAKC